MTSPSPSPVAATPAVPTPAELAPALLDMGLDGSSLSKLGDGSQGNKIACAYGDPAAPAPHQEMARLELPEDGTLLVYLPGPPPLKTLAAWRNSLWPLLHVPAWYLFDGSRIRRHEYNASRQVGETPLAGALLVAQRRTHLMRPGATVTKFDQNAPHWDGDAKGPGYPHFRWMRRFVGCFARRRDAKRILDFGCGAGWCGIEAARMSPGASLCSFDPSPRMVEQTQANATAHGIQSFQGRTGFGESPPFPGPGEEPFDLVISSGVISFSPDPQQWLASLPATVQPGGDLVIGDIQWESAGFRARRKSRPVLPSRELSALSAESVRADLERLGFVFVRQASYQLTWPVPQLMHLNEQRLGGVLTYPLLWANQLAACLSAVPGFPKRLCFDSWVMHFRRPV